MPEINGIAPETQATKAMDTKEQEQPMNDETRAVLEEIKRALSEGFASLEKMLREEYINEKTLELILKPIKDDVADLKKSRNWVVGIVMTAVLLAILGVVIVSRVG